MSVIFVLLPVALLFAGVALAVFMWAARSGQFDDLHTPGVRILYDDAPPSAGRHEPARDASDDPPPDRGR